MKWYQRLSNAEEKYFNCINKKTIVWNKSDKYKNYVLFCDDTNVIAIEFNNSGKSIRKSSLLISEELEILETTCKLKIKNIEFLAKKVAREVAKTKVEAKLDSMNSYERRIVHSILSDDKFVYTESIGEEPNRCVVIKPKEM